MTGEEAFEKRMIVINSNNGQRGHRELNTFRDGDWGERHGRRKTETEK